MAYVVDRVVICDAFREPEKHYQLLTGGRSKLAEGRRPSMRFLASAKDVKGGIAGVVGKEAGLFEDMLASAEQKNDFVNQLRDEVREWREAGYPGTAGVTRRLLEWWFERDEERRATAAALLLLPAGGGRDGHLPLRGAGPAQDARDRRPPALRAQARHRHRQDRGDGALRHLVDAAQAQGERLVALGELPRAGAEPHGARPGERPAARRRARPDRRAQPLRRLRHGAAGVPGGVPAERLGAQLAGHPARGQARRLDRRGPGAARGGPLHPAGGAAGDAAPRPAGPERGRCGGCSAAGATSWSSTTRRTTSTARSARRRARTRPTSSGARSSSASRRPRASRLVLDLSATPWYGSGSPKPEGTLYEWLVSRLLGLRRLRVGARQGGAAPGPRRAGARLPRPVGPREGREDQGGVPARLQGRDREHLLVVEEGLRRVGGPARVRARRRARCSCASPTAPSARRGSSST